MSLGYWGSDTRHFRFRTIVCSAHCNYVSCTGNGWRHQWKCFVMLLVASAAQVPAKPSADQSTCTRILFLDRSEHHVTQHDFEAVARNMEGWRELQYQQHFRLRHLIWSHVSQKATAFQKPWPHPSHHRMVHAMVWHGETKCLYSLQAARISITCHGNRLHTLPVRWLFPPAFCDVPVIAHSNHQEAGPSHPPHHHLILGASGDASLIVGKPSISTCRCLFLSLRLGYF